MIEDTARRIPKGDNMVSASLSILCSTMPRNDTFPEQVKLHPLDLPAWIENFVLCQAE